MAEVVILIMFAVVFLLVFVVPTLIIFSVMKELAKGHRRYSQHDCNMEFLNPTDRKNLHIWRGWYRE